MAAIRRGVQVGEVSLFPFQGTHLLPVWHVKQRKAVGFVVRDEILPTRREGHYPLRGELKHFTAVAQVVDGAEPRTSSEGCHGEIAPVGGEGRLGDDSPQPNKPPNQARRRIERLVWRRRR